MDVEKAIFDGGIEHVLPNGRVEGIRDVDDGELDWSCHFHFFTVDCGTIAYQSIKFIRRRAGKMKVFMFLGMRGTERLEVGQVGDTGKRIYFLIRSHPVSRSWLDTYGTHAVN